MKVSVIIVTYNGESWISACLESLQLSTHLHDVVVVDNASSDSTKSIIEERFKEVTLLKSPENLGFGQANNLGIAFALQQETDFIFLLNQDTTVESDAIGKLVEGFALHPEFDLLSPAHYNSEGTHFDFGFSRYALHDYTTAEINNWYAADPKECFPISFVNAAAWCVKASVFERIGGFSPLFFHYGEDREYAQRMHFHSLKIGIIPAAKICHYRDSRNNNAATWAYSKRMKYYWVGYLYRLSDVNKNFFSQFFFSFYWLLKDCTSLLLRKVFSAPYMFFHVLFKTLSSFKEVKAHRRRVKNPKPYLFLTRYMN